jgi:hypothetical protein
MVGPPPDILLVPGHGILHVVKVLTSQILNYKYYIFLINMQLQVTDFSLLPASFNHLQMPTLKLVF